MATILERKWKGGTTYQAKVRKKGRNTSETFDRRSDAMRWAEDREEEIKNNLPFPWEKGEFKSGVFEKDETLARAIGKFIHETKGSVSRGQTDNYLTYQNQLLRYFGSDKMMSGIGHADMAAYILKRTNEDGVGPVTIRAELSLVRRVYEHAAGWGVNFESPEKDIKRPKRKQLSREDRLDKVASPDELNAIFRSAKFRQNNLYLYLRFLLFTGMRPSEAATLYWERLPAKQEKEEEKHKRSIGFVDLERGGFSKVGTKVETRFVPAHPETLAILKQLKKCRKKKPDGQLNKLVFLDDKFIEKKKAYMFYRRSMYTTLANAVVIGQEEQKKLSEIMSSDLGPIVKERAVGKLGRPLQKELNFYTFRHTVRSNMARSGIATEVGETIIGHNDASFKFTYIHLDDDVLIREMEKLNYPGLEEL